jgi:hypothetical protein
MEGNYTVSDKDHPAWGILILAGSLTIALVSSRDYAGSFNDGSRLATVESLVDHHTLAIDRSIFVQVPPPQVGVPGPYHDEEDDAPFLTQWGTLDKLFVNGHFYSDKSPVPALLMAGWYGVWQQCTGWRAADHPDRFCYWMTFGTSGLAYVMAVWCVYQLGRPLRLPLGLRLALTASFALATVAPAYARHVNNHVLLLGVAAPLMLGLARLAEATGSGAPNRTPWGRLLRLGTLAGLGYTIDLGTGPALLLCVVPVIAWRVRRPGPVVLFVLAALPWLIAHHAVNYAVGGTFRPANANPEYFQWAGFSAETLTGSWQHHNFLDFFLYVASLLFGKRGFLTHNLPLLLALPAMVRLLKTRVPETPELLFALCWCGGTWLLYGALSNNSSGLCCSIRWFVPLLAPAYYALAVFLREHARHRKDFAVLTAFGLFFGGWTWWKGTWMPNMIPAFWPVVAATLLSWVWCLTRRPPETMATSARPIAAAQSETVAANVHRPAA